MEKMTLEAYLKGLQDKGENGTSKHKLRNENLQEKHRVARIQRLKKEKKKKSKLVLFAELAFPFNPTTGEADDVYGPDSKFRPEVTPIEAALMMKGYAHENAALKESLMRRAGVDNWDTSAVDQFTDDDKVIFKRYRVPSLYTFPVVNINIPVMTKDFARDYLIKVARDPMTGEVLGDVPVALQYHLHKVLDARIADVLMESSDAWKYFKLLCLQHDNKTWISMTKRQDLGFQGFNTFAPMSHVEDNIFKTMFRFCCDIKYAELLNNAPDDFPRYVEVSGKIYDTALVIANDLSLKEALKSVDITQLLISSEKVEVLHA